MESNPGPGESGDGAMGLLEPVWRLPMWRRSRKIWRKFAARWKQLGWSSRPMLRAEIEGLFDENPARYSDRTPRLFQQFKGRAECGRGARGGAGCGVEAAGA